MSACHRGQFGAIARGCFHATLLTALTLGPNAVMAEEEAVAAPGAMLVAQASGVRPMLEMSSSELPRFDGDASMRTSRLTLLPGGRSALGLSFGVTSASGPSSSALPSFSAVAPIVDLGLHWRHELDGSYRLDITAWRRVGNVDAISLIQSRDYGARVEMGLASGNQGPRSGFVADRGFVGVQLEGGARVTVKRSGGRPMLYYRNNF